MAAKGKKKKKKIKFGFFFKQYHAHKIENKKKWVIIIIYIGGLKKYMINNM